MPASPARPADRARVLDELRRAVRRLEGTGEGNPAGARPLGCPALDAALPDGRGGGGLPLGCLHEVRGDRGAATGFAARLAALAAAGRPVVWAARRLDLYAPGLAALGIDPARLIVVRARSAAEVLWAMEEALACRALGAVVGEDAGAGLAESRRLQLAAEASGVTAFLLAAGEAAGSARDGAGAAVTRWRIDPAPGRLDAAAADGEGGDEPGLGPPRWRAELRRARGGRPGVWLLEPTAGGFAEAGTRAGPADAAGAGAGARAADPDPSSRAA
jgi:protein ImuA